MRTNQRAVVIITKGDKILLINRTNGDRNYYILPGGGVESEETPEQAAVREAKEELGLDISIKETVVSFENQGGTEYYFLANEIAGEITFSGDTNPTNKIIDKDEWVNFSEIINKNIMPEKIKEILITRFTK